MPLLEIQNVSRHFGEFHAVDDVSLAIEAGEFFTLLGPSGCGKTTLLRMIAGFDRPDSGNILLDGKDIDATPPEQRPIHTVFQSYALFPHLSVAQNVAFPLRMAKVGSAEITARVAEALHDVHLPDLGKRYPHELSGGQKQRVAIARALINRPRLLLLDEPLAALDLKLREQLQLELINLQKEIGVTFVYVTHDQGEALALSHRIAVMNKGRIAQLGTPNNIYEFPQNRFVADFIGTCNLFNAEVLETGEAGKLALERIGAVHATLPSEARVGSRGALALRPEKVRLDREITPAVNENHFRGTVHDHLYLGDVTVYIVEVSGGALVEALLPNSGARGSKLFAVGDAVEIAWHKDAGRFMGE